jgi:heptose II phosphotransferase
MDSVKPIVSVWQQWWLYRYSALLEDRDAQQILIDIDDFGKTLKDDKRSFVRLGEINGTQVVAKQPRDKNRRKWSRLLSLVRDGEAYKSAKTLVEFEALGIPSLTPLAVLEKRRYGMIMDSWIIYQYREGNPVELEQIDQVLALLKTLHQSGYRHDDPNLLNFLMGKDQQVFLIDCKGRPRIGRFSDYYDYFLLSDRNSNIDDNLIEQRVDFDKSSFSYRLAKWYRNYKQFRSTLKNRIRNKK